MDYAEEKSICEYLGLRVNKSNYVLAYYGHCKNNDKPTSWQIVCHISKLRDYLTRQIHPEHYVKVK